MGTKWSSLEPEPSPDLWWSQPQPPPDITQDESKVELAEGSDRRERGRIRHEELEIFKKELAQKRALRHEALAALQAELRDLRKQVEEERDLRLDAEKERDKLKIGSDERLLKELENEKEEKKKLQEERERLIAEVEEKAGLERQVQALKDVSQIGKEMLRIRELQVKELKKKLVEINISSVMAPPEDLRVEYEKQIENIRKLRTLYEERAAATLLKHKQELEREEARIVVLETKLSDLNKESEGYKEAKQELEEKIENLERTIQNKEDEFMKTKDDLLSVTAQNKTLGSQMTLINNLFSHMLVNPKVDLDRLIRLLKENHGLITDLTEKGDSNEVAALLVDLASQIEKEQEADLIQDQNSESTGEHSESQSEIASNLTKVWKVMIELLSHHQNSNHIEAGGAESCYKCIQTPSGPRSVISVSQTYLTLKDLILEKNQLVQEVGRLKTLNNHLEHRLGSQEKRLSIVTTELRKTWGVVNKLKAQHKQLHTHEKILRYELQQKRCMLSELKEELEHCRDKWDRARQKNTQTEEDWKKLRKEFAARKSRKESNSAESGYEEEDIAQSPPSEPINHEANLFEYRTNDESEPDLSEEEIEHSDGNSFETVIDLLDIACLENQSGGEPVIPFVLHATPPPTSEPPQSLLPLTNSEFTEGLDQIESEDLAAVLDIQYQNQLLGADYNLSLPSSSGSSPIPTENDDFASSEMDISEEDSSLHENLINSSPLPATTQSIPEDMLLFGSNSSKNISKFLDGLFLDQEQNKSRMSSPNHLYFDLPSTSQVLWDDDSATPLVNNNINTDDISDGNKTPKVNNENCYIFPLKGQDLTLQGVMNDNHLRETDNTKQLASLPQALSVQTSTISYGGGCEEHTAVHTVGSSSLCNSETKTTEEMLKSREDRLKRLEKQCRSLVSKVTSTSFRNEIISNKLDQLHNCYGSSQEVSDLEEEPPTKMDANKNEHLQKKPKESDSTSLRDTGTLTSDDSDYYRNVNSTEAQDGLRSLKNENVFENFSPEQQKTHDEILEARSARLKRLEDQCKMLFSKMSATSSRSELISNKLDELHGAHGASEQTTEVELPTTSDLHNSKILCSCKAEAIINEASDTQCDPMIKEELIHSKSTDLASESKKILNQCSPPSTSIEPIITSSEFKEGRTHQEILDARAERFKRLEEQCKSLVSKMTATSLRSEIISNKLDELHSCYGSSEDISDSEEHSTSSREGVRRRSSPNSSPKYNKKIICSSEKEKAKECAEPQNSEISSIDRVNERIPLPQVTDAALEFPNNSTAAIAEGSKRTPEEILQARAQRLNRLEEQCKSLFSKMSATSQRSDVISNRLEELHEQYGQPSTAGDVTLSSINNTLSVRDASNETDNHNEGRTPLHRIENVCRGSEDTSSADDIAIPDNDKSN